MTGLQVRAEVSFVTLLARLLPHIDMSTGAATELGMCLMVR